MGERIPGIVDGLLAELAEFEELAKTEEGRRELDYRIDAMGCTEEAVRGLRSYLGILPAQLAAQRSPPTHAIEAMRWKRAN